MYYIQEKVSVNFIRSNNSKTNTIKVLQLTRNIFKLLRTFLQTCNEIRSNFRILISFYSMTKSQKRNFRRIKNNNRPSSYCTAEAEKSLLSPAKFFRQPTIYLDFSSYFSSNTISTFGKVKKQKNQNPYRSMAVASSQYIRTE